MANGNGAWLRRLIDAVLGGDEVTWLRALVLASLMVLIGLLSGFLQWPLRTELAAQSEKLASVERALVAYIVMDCLRQATSEGERRECRELLRAPAAPR